MKALLPWFDRNKRDLPWRRNRSPYATWISEIMLQQTRVETVKPYFDRWMERFPDVNTLAAADEQDVLRLWEGLGYYSRARSIHKAAKQIVNEYNGAIPPDPALLRKLPGIGDYTAGAIASIGYGLPAAALDGNIRRILARFYDIADPVRTPQTEKKLWTLAEGNLDRERPGDFNEALMDLGSAICLPENPQCLLCPIAENCLARQHGTMNERPVMLKAEPVPHYIVTAAVIPDGTGERFLLTKRPDKGLLGGLWEFPGGKQEAGESLKECIVREIREELDIAIEAGEPFGIYKHAYTHFKVTLHAFICHHTSGTPKTLASSELGWFTREELRELPMGKIDRMIAKKLTADSR
ncbi:MAG: A/G-specific adenine glycosylase [Anaerolineaceae bacterium]|nr:A/G-specific adenine glycosylase [Anaerolineaceae bacterium]